MAEVSVPTNPNTSPPPNCAICLGPCTNKCFSDSCMHQFCFKCLLEWSKVKAVCPLCKQPFTSIIHNVKSNNEYEEHIIESNEVHQVPDVLDETDFLYLPSAPPSRHFQFRTTFTVDPRGELAIQQMLLTHPLTNSLYTPGYNYSNYRFGRHRRRDTSSTNFRRSIYIQNLWVTAEPDITGRYREVSPNFYRENPAARNRLVPWLNRELNALLSENTQHVMHLVDIILGHLSHHDIRSRFFKNLLREYLGIRTEHFIHEFYNFMRSPYDMIGYDRHVFYSPRYQYVDTISTEDEGDEVTAVVPENTENSNIFRQPTIEVIEINSDSSRDSDVIIQEPTPVIVDLVNSDTEQVVIDLEDATSHSESDNKFNVLRKRDCCKRKMKIKNDSLTRKYPLKKRIIISSSSNDSSSTSSSCSSSTSSSSSSSKSDSTRESSDEKYVFKYLKKKRKQKIPKRKTKYSQIYSDSYSNSSDDEPLSGKLKKLKEKKFLPFKIKTKIVNNSKKASKRKHRSKSSKNYSSDSSTSSGYKSKLKIKLRKDVPLDTHYTFNECPSVASETKPEAFTPRLYSTPVVNTSITNGKKNKMESLYRAANEVTNQKNKLKDFYRVHIETSNEQDKMNETVATERIKADETNGNERNKVKDFLRLHNEITKLKNETNINEMKKPKDCHIKNEITNERNRLPDLISDTNERFKSEDMDQSYYLPNHNKNYLINGDIGSGGDGDEYFAGPSNSQLRFSERQKLWYSRPYVCDSDSSVD